MVPETLEAKLMATLDSASHLTGTLYIFLFNYGKGLDYIIDKIERLRRSKISLKYKNPSAGV